VGDLVVVAPVAPLREEPLKRHLAGLKQRSPLAELPCHTHFARFVVLPLDGPQLLFSSRFDATEDAYIAALSQSAELRAIWAHCASDEDLGDPETLRRYLTAHSIDSPYILAAWSGVSVREVNLALERRARLGKLVTDAETLGPVGLGHAFREQFRR
jgi:hypothetical protein